MIKITKAEFETLPQAVQGLFKADASGEFYILAAESEDAISGLKAKNVELLGEKKKAEARLAELEKLHAERTAKDEEAETEKAKAAGQFAELEKKLREKIAEVEQAAEESKAALIQTIKAERVKNLLIEKGMLADRAEYALPSVLERFELADDLSLRVKDGIGDAKEVDAVIGQLKEKTPFFFASTQATGSGASGGSFNGGGDSKTMTRDAFIRLSAAEQMAFSVGGGTLTD